MSNEFLGNMPYPPQPRASAFKWGLIGAGILAGIEIAWYILTYYGYWLDDIISYLTGSSPLRLDIVLVCLPILAALPVFFWISQQAARQTGLARTGINAAFQACGWWVIVKIILLGADILLGFLLLAPFWSSAVYILAILLMFGAAWLMGTIAAQANGSQGNSLVGQYPAPPLQVSGSGVTPGGYPSPTPQAYQPPAQSQTALEILQLRFARGEIDPATYQEMRGQLEASARSNPHPHQ
jgi:hypothetical protein